MDERPPIDNDPPRPAWHLLFRAIGAASDPRCLVLAALGLTAMTLGQSAITLVFGDAPWEVGPPWSGLGWPRRDDGLATMAPARLLDPILAVLAPFVAVFSPVGSAFGRLHAAVAAVWALAVWSLFGGAIARVAVVRVARMSRVGIVAALKFSAVRFGALIAGPLAALGVAWLIGLVGAGVGLLNRLPEPWGSGAATVMAIVPLVVGLLDAVILLGLAAAWPLMVLTVVAEGEDFFDAISRSYSYVNQRTALYAGYVATVAALGLVGLVVVSRFVMAALGLADWSVALAAPRNVGFRFLRPAPLDASGAAVVGRFWTGMIETLTIGWSYSYLWSSAAIIYLLLRRDVDGAEIHDVYETSEEAEPFAPDDPPTEAGSTAPEG